MHLAHHLKKADHHVSYEPYQHAHEIQAEYGHYSAPILQTTQLEEHLHHPRVHFVDHEAISHEFPDALISQYDRMRTRHNPFEYFNEHYDQKLSKEGAHDSSVHHYLMTAAGIH